METKWIGVVYICEKKLMNLLTTFGVWKLADRFWSAKSGFKIILPKNDFLVSYR